MASLVKQRDELRKEVKQYETMLRDAYEYLTSSKFHKFQDSSPNELCDKVQVNDILRRLDIENYREL